MEVARQGVAKLIGIPCLNTDYDFLCHSNRATVVLQCLFKKAKHRTVSNEKNTWKTSKTLQYMQTFL